MTSNSINYLRMREDTRTHKANEKIGRGQLRNAIRMTRETIRHDKATEKQAINDWKLKKRQGDYSNKTQRMSVKESVRHDKATEKQARNDWKLKKSQGDYSNKSGRISAEASKIQAAASASQAATAKKNADTNYLNYLLGIQGLELKGREVTAKEALTASQVKAYDAQAAYNAAKAVTESYQPKKLLAEIDKIKAEKGKTKKEKALTAAKLVAQEAENVFAQDNALLNYQTNALKKLKASIEEGNLEKTGKLLQNDIDNYQWNMLLGNGGATKLLSMFMK